MSTFKTPGRVDGGTMRGGLGTAVVMVAVCLGLAATGAFAASSSQQVYDAAQAAFDKSDWAGASTGFRNLLPTEPDTPLDRSQAVIAYRYAYSLLRLGREDEARLWIDRALPGLSHDADQGVFGEALLVKGDLARAEYDYTTAADAYDKANTAFGSGAIDIDVLKARLGLAVVGVTLEPTHVFEVLAPLLDDRTALKGLDRASLAQVEELGAEAALNRGDTATASRLIEKAVSQSGALTTQVNVLQSYVRSDAGLIARLEHDDEETRRYFAYSGAGHMEDMSWIGQHSGDLPVCGDTAGSVRPDDSVVVRFQIAADGHVEDATPVYASRVGVVGETFARTVSRWRWDPNTLKSVSPFWRLTLQLELRCIKRPQPEDFDRRSWEATLAWLDEKGLLRPGDRAPGGDTTLFRRADDPQLRGLDGAALEALSRRTIDSERMQALWTRLDAIHAPADIYALMIERSARDGWDGQSPGGAMRSSAEHYAQWNPRFAQQFPNSPASDWLTLDEAIAWEGARDFRAAAPLLQRVLSAPSSRLAADDPIRRVALLHQAIGLDRGGQTKEAHEVLASSGLTVDQCALFDTHPVPRNQEISSAAFPAEALRWNFEGYVQEDFDILDNGSVANVRTVVAYPPYIFEATTENAVKDFKYFPPRLGGQAVGCEGQRQSVNYRIGS